MVNNGFYKRMLDNIYEGMYFVDTERMITFWNKGAERISGFTSEEVLGRHCFDNILNHVDDEGNKLCFGGCPLHKTIEDGEMRDTVIYLHHKEGHRVTVKVRTIPLVENGEIVGAIEMFVDKSVWLNAEYSDDELKVMALMDQLTGLPNRRHLDDAIAQQIHMCNAFDEPFSVAFIDIDHFKKFNDTYGHLVGDKVLKMVGKTLKDAVREADSPGRWGGEEFLVVLPRATGDALKGVCEKIRMLIENSVLREQDEPLSVTVSIGATQFKAGEAIESLLERADKLLYTSKEAGRNQVTVG